MRAKVKLPIVVPPPVTAADVAASRTARADRRGGGSKAASAPAPPSTAAAASALAPSTLTRPVLPSVSPAAHGAKGRAARRGRNPLARTSGAALGGGRNRGRDRGRNRNRAREQPAARFAHLDLVRHGGGKQPAAPSSPSGFSVARPEELEKARRAVVKIETSMHDKIDAGWSELPMDFVVEQRTKAYCQQRGVEMLERIYIQIALAGQRSAFDIWIKRVKAERKRVAEEEATEYKQGRGMVLLTATVAKMQRRHLAKGLQRWLRCVKRMRYMEKHLAAKMIQNFSRKVTACRFIVLLKRERTTRSDTKDAMMRGVAFFEFRTRRGAAETRAASADALRLYQAHQREVRAASRLQAIYRGVLGRVDADKTRRIVEQYRAFVEECARHLQRVFRGKTGRLAADGIRAANAEALAGQNRSATTMQSLFRAKKEQKQVVAMRARYEKAAMRLQKMWRKRMGDWELHLRFVAKRAALKVAREEEAIRIAALRLKSAIRAQSIVRRLCAARRSQRRRRQIVALATARRRDALRRNRAAAHVQHFWRVYFERCAAIRRFIMKRKAMINRAAAAQKAAVPWLTKYAMIFVDVEDALAPRAPDSLALHEIQAVRLCVRKCELLEDAGSAATNVLKVMRGYLARRYTRALRRLRARQWRALQTYCATDIQRVVYRGTMGRYTVANVRAQYRVGRLARKIPGLIAKFSIEHIMETEGRWVSKTQRAELIATIDWATNFLLMSNAALQVQSVVMGLNARRRVMRMRKERAEALRILREESSSLIQERCAKWLERRTCRVKALRRVTRQKLRLLSSAGDAYTRTRDVNDYPGQSLLTKHKKLLGMSSRMPQRVSMAEADELYTIAKESWHLLQRDRGALKLQCRYRIRTCGMATMLLRQARDRQLALEKRSASLVQARFRANQARNAMHQMAIQAKREGMKDEYLSERHAASAREVWLKGEKEARARDMATRKLERIHRAQTLALDEAERLNEVKRRQAEVARIAANAESAQRKFEAHLQYEAAAKKAWRRYADEAGTVYYHNLVTAENVWEPPKDWEEDRRANPPVMTDMSTQMDMTPPLCQACHVIDACRVCNDCQINFCFSCYAEEHSRPDKEFHTYKQLEISHEKAVCCTHCESNDACYKVKGETDTSEGDRPNDNFFCEECFTYLYSYDVPPPYSAFTAGTPACVECNSRIAQRRCQGCHNDPLCLTCFPILHRGAVMASHDFLRIDTGECDVLKAGQMFCTECERQKASIVCHQCNDDFCMDCFQITHRRGRRAEHTTSPWEEARGSGWEEIADDETGTVIYFNRLTKTRTEDKPIQLMFGAERAEHILRQEEIAARKAVEADLAKTTKTLAKTTSDRDRLLNSNQKLIGKARSQTLNRIKMVGNLIMPSIVTIDTDDYASSKAAKEEELADFDNLQDELRQKIKSKAKGAERARAFRHETVERKFFEKKLARKYESHEAEANAVYKQSQNKELAKSRRSKLQLK